MSATAEQQREFGDEAAVAGGGCSRRRFLRTALAMAVWGPPVYAATVGAHWLEVTQHTVRLDGLPSALAGLRVVQLTDIHRSPWIGERYFDHVIEQCRRLEPDLVVVTGDLIDYHARFARPCARALARLTPRYGIHAVLGNHDWWHGPQAVIAALAEVGIPTLVNQAQAIAPGLWLAGIDDLWVGAPDVGRVLAAVPPGEACLLLSHNPRALPAVQSRSWVVLAGHTHGGQIRVPGIAPVVPVDVQPAGYLAGWYSAGLARMYISRGIGTTRIALRLGCRPEVPVFRLACA